MKHQQVSVDYWSMGKAMVTYGALTALVWMMLRLFNAVFMLPRRLRDQQNNMENTLKELQRRYPNLNITEEDLKDAEKEFEELMKEEGKAKEIKDKADSSETPGLVEAETTEKSDEDKKTL